LRKIKKEPGVRPTLAHCDTSGYAVSRRRWRSALVIILKENIMPTKKRSILYILVLALGLGLATSAGAESRADQVNDIKADQTPAVRLSHWKSSSVAEQNSFLFGFVTMLGLEKEWRQGKELPVKQSLANCWIKGFNGVTIQQMREAIDAYAAAHPEDTERQVVEVLWIGFVQPKLSAQERKDVAAAYKAGQGRKK
jgi:hypothetical protein